MSIIRLNEMGKTLLILSFGIAGFFGMSPVFGQSSLLDKEIVLDKTTGTIAAVLTEISVKGGFTFSYGNQIDIFKSVTLRAIRQSVRAHLSDIFPNGEVVYVVEADKILLSYRGNK